MNRPAVHLLLAVLVVALPVTLGLAVPSINTNAQEAGGGAGLVSSPVPDGSVCVPYAYYYYVPLLGLIGPYYLSGIPEVYIGNFSSDLYAGTNVSVVVYGSSQILSIGAVTLVDTLPSGNYTAVEINPTINYDQALNSEFHVVLQPPNSTILNFGPISLAVQEIGSGYPDGEYNDYLVLYYDGEFYQIYVGVRCYELTFAPTTYSERERISPEKGALGEVSGGSTGKIVPASFNTLKEQPIRENGHNLSNLPELLNESTYLKDILFKIRGIIKENGGG